MSDLEAFIIEELSGSQHRNEVELVTELGVVPDLVRSALKELSDEGLIATVEHDGDTLYRLTPEASQRVRGPLVGAA